MMRADHRNLFEVGDAEPRRLAEMNRSDQLEVVSVVDRHETLGCEYDIIVFKTKDFHATREVVHQSTRPLHFVIGYGTSVPFIRKIFELFEFEKFFIIRSSPRDEAEDIR